jgi:hypothetical protein
MVVVKLERTPGILKEVIMGTSNVDEIIVAGGL